MTFREKFEPLLTFIEQTEEILAGIAVALDRAGCYNSSEPLVESVLRLIAERDAERRRAAALSDVEFKQAVLERLTSLQALAQPLWIYQENPPLGSDPSYPSWHTGATA